MRIASRVFAAIAFIVATLAPALAQAPPPAPPWNPAGGTVDPKDPTLWHNPKDGPSDYVWNPKICRWVYKGAGKDAVGTHKAGDVATQGPPVGVPPGTGKMNPGGLTAKDGNGNTYTYDDDTTDAKGVRTPGKGWVDDKTGKSLCTPPAAAAVAPGANTGPAPQTVPGQGVAPEHTSVTPPPGATTVSTGVPAATVPVATTQTPGHYYNTPYYNSPLEAWFYNAPYNTPYYNSPFDAWFYNTPYNTPIGATVWDGIYIGVNGGLSIVPTVTATEFFNDGKDRFLWGTSTGSYFGAQAGWQSGNWRAEGQYTWSYNPAAATMPLPPDFKIGGNTETSGFFGNVIYTPPFTLGIPLTPHIGVGIGALNVSTTVKINDMKVFDSSGWAPAAQAIGGVTYTMSPKWSIDLDYRYQTTLSDVEYRTLPVAGSDIRNRVTAPWAGHFFTLGMNLHFPAGTRPPSSPSPAPPAPKSEIPQARQVAALTSVETAAAAAHRFTLRYDEATAALTRSSVQALHEALDAIEAGQSVQIAIAGCETDADYSNGSLCAHRARRVQHLLARYGVENPGHYFVGG
jgi:opacity protein-like surface antigen